MFLPRIAIVGGGPAGLLVARLLNRVAIPSLVFEADQNRTSRVQGGTLDLHKTSGQRALRRAGLYEAFLKFARPEGEKLRIYDHHENLLIDEDDGKGKRPEELHDRPEIDRKRLRDLLLDSLNEHQIKWDHAVKNIEQSSEGEQEGVCITFKGEESTRQIFDVVIGADGAWSKVRQFLTPEKPHFCGVTGAEVYLHDVDRDHPEIAKRVGEGMCLTFGPGKAIIAQRNGDNIIQAYAFARAAEDWHKTSGIDWTDTKLAKTKCIESTYSDFSTNSQNLILQSDSTIVPRPLFKLPVGFRWTHNPCVSLIGDAAHLMPPFAGVGVNIAMEDALELSDKIISRRDEWTDRQKCLRAVSAAIKDYESAMYVRAEENARKTEMFQGLFFSQRGAQSIVDYFEQQNRQAADA